MSEDLVWAFAPIKELNNETGFVACDSELAKELIESGKVQDPRDGALHLKEIQTKQAKAPKEPKVVVKEEEPKEEVKEERNPQSEEGDK